MGKGEKVASRFRFVSRVFIYLARFSHYFGQVVGGRRSAAFPLFLLIPLFYVAYFPVRLAGRQGRPGPWKSRPVVII